MPMKDEEINSFTISYAGQHSRQAVLKALDAFDFKGEGIRIPATTPELILASETAGTMTFEDALDWHIPQNRPMSEYMLDW